MHLEEAVMDTVLVTSSFDGIGSVVIAPFLDMRTLDDSSPRGATNYATSHGRAAHSLYSESAGACAT
jgi:hypothetical protein